MIAVAFVAVAGFTAYLSQSEKLHLSSLAMENIEALADDESGYDRACADGTHLSWKDDDASFCMLCNPCGSYDYIDVSSRSRC